MDNNTKHIVRGAEVSKKRERERDWSRFSILERERERERYYQSDIILKIKGVLV